MIPLRDLNLNPQSASRFVERNICSICNGKLVVAFINRQYVLKCGNSKDHAGIRPIKTGNEELEELMEEQSKALGKPAQSLATVTAQDLEIILKRSYPGAPDLEIKKALMLCRKYDLDPLVKHIFLIKFEGKRGDTWAVVMGIKATRAMARRRLSYSYVSGPRRMTEDEQKAIYGEISKDKFWALTILKDRNGNEYPGYGFWPLDKDVYGAEKGNTKANMAFIRSERNALDKLMPEGSPPVEVVDENYIEGEATLVERLPELPANFEVDTEKDADSAPSSAPAVAETPKQAETPASGEKEASPDKPRTFANAGEFMNAITSELKLSRKDLFDQLGIKNVEEIKDLSAAWKMAVSFQEFLKKQPAKK